VTPLLGGFLILVGFSVIVLGGYLFFKSMSIIRNGAEAEGMITSIDTKTRTTRESDGHRRTTTDYWLTVRFRDANEQTYTFRSGGSSSDQVGYKVRVIYNRNNPGEAKLNSFASLWGGAIFLPIMGVLFMGFGVLITSLER